MKLNVHVDKNGNYSKFESKLPTYYSQYSLICVKYLHVQCVVYNVLHTWEQC